VKETKRQRREKKEEEQQRNIESSLSRRSTLEEKSVFRMNHVMNLCNSFVCGWNSLVEIM
jgi:hypothetical protein